MGIGSPLTNIMGFLLVAGIIVLAIAAIVTIAYGMRMRAKRRAAEVEVAERGEEVGISSRPARDAIAEPATPPETSQVPATPAEPAPATRPAESPAPVATPVAAPVAAPVASTPAPPVAAVKPAGDSLLQVKGLGPKVAARLGELGVTTVGQLARLSPAEAEALDAQLGTFRGRMARDRWIEQAKLLAAGDRAGFEAAFGKL